MTTVSWPLFDREKTTGVTAMSMVSTLILVSIVTFVLLGFIAILTPISSPRMATSKYFPNWLTYSKNLYCFDDPDYPPSPFEREAVRSMTPGSRLVIIGDGLSARLSTLALCIGAALVVYIDPRASGSILANRSAVIAGALSIGRMIIIPHEFPNLDLALLGLQFDYAFTQSATHYLDRLGRVQTYEAIRLSLRLGGTYFSAVQSVLSARVLRGEARRIGNTDRWECDDGVERTFYTPTTLAEELQAAGFDIEEGEIRLVYLEGYEFPGEPSLWLFAIARRTI